MRKLTTQEFIEKAKQIHGDRYNYSQVAYINSKMKVKIICPEHGEFWQLPKDHINKGANCPVCGAISRAKNQRKSTTIQFIEKAKRIHNGKYNYFKTQYINAKTKVIITCPIHGDFVQTPNNHLNGQGCPQCSLEQQIKEQSMSQQEFIDRASSVHCNKYDYSKTQYANTREKIIITCPEHGDFIQLARNHLKGCGCPKCSYSNGEKFIRKFLEDQKILYSSQYVIPISSNINSSGQAYIDFYLPDLDIAIEYNGIQHYKYIPYFHKGGIADFKHQKDRDAYVREYCHNRKIKLIEISYEQSQEQILSLLNNELVRN